MKGKREKKERKRENMMSLIGNGVPYPSLSARLVPHG